jgi:glycosyltransferase involved in cell wall biosynthesis
MNDDDMNMADVVVSVMVITYNQEAYIARTLESVLMQQTDFDYELVIGEDSSTDRTRDIVRDYADRFPGRIRLVLAEKNLGPSANSLATLKACRGRYIAICEGDDYWVDPLKLQKQVGFLNLNPEYSLCCGSFESLNEGSGERNIINKFNRSAGADGVPFSLDEMEDEWLTKTLTVCFRRDALFEYFSKAPKYAFRRDVHLFYHLIKEGKGFYSNDVLGVYRIHGGGLYSANVGVVNTNVAYHCYRELYVKNGDYFTRRMYLRSTLNLFNFDLTHRYAENTIARLAGLFFTSVRLANKRQEFGWVVKSLIPIRIKLALKRMTGIILGQQRL